jgi:hypothetical protein
MNKPWIGAARPSTAEDMRLAAARLECDLPAILAIWDVEASGREFKADGSLPRRFEPHKLPGSTMTWRDSLAMSEKDRWALFDQAYASGWPDAALRATSWGAPQIMGFHAQALGFQSTKAMVEAFAESGGNQINAFVSFVVRNGLATHVRAHDWYKFAVGYNGSGQPEAYAKKIEAAYRRHSGGHSSPVILRFGAQGDEVRRVQSALGIPADGVFGTETEGAVRTFQIANGLTPDGIVGFKTWTALESRISRPPAAQPTQTDTIMDQVGKASGVVTGAAAAATAVRGVFPDHVWEIISIGFAAAVTIMAAIFVLKRFRR